MATLPAWSKAEFRPMRLASWLRARGVTRVMRVLVLLGNQVELWETTLAVMKQACTTASAFFRSRRLSSVST